MARELPVIDGVRLIHVEDHDLGIVFAEVAVEAGSFHDPEGKEGLANLTASMLLRGTKGRSYQQIMDDVNDLGANLDTSARKEIFAVSGDFMTRYQDVYADIVADVLSGPVFPGDQFENERGLIMQEILNARNDDASLARRYFYRFLYRAHPLGRPIQGYPGTVKKLKPEDCRDYYKRHMRKGNLIVVLAGDIDEEGAREFVRKVTAGIPDGPRETVDVPKPSGPKGIEVLVVDKPDRTQTQVLMGRPSLNWGEPDLFPVLVGNTAFGGTFTSRLMREIREKRGWSYGASSSVSAGRNTGTLGIRFFPENKDTVPAIRLTFKLLHDLTGDGLTDTETRFAKDHLANQFPFRLETARRRAGEMLADEIFDRPDDYIGDYVASVRRQTTKSVNAALAKWYGADDIAIVVVGTAEGLVEDLKGLPGVSSVKVHPYDKDEL